MATNRQTTEAVSRLWDEHRNAEFPAGLAGEELAGADLVMLDADVAGCVVTWIGNAGRLDPTRSKVLGRCVSDLDRVLHLINDAQRKRYFERLRETRCAGRWMTFANRGPSPQSCA